MRPLVDAATLSLGVFSWSFLVVMLVLLPVAVLSQQRRLAEMEQAGVRLERRDVYTSALATHGLMLVAAWLVVRETGLRLFPPVDLSVRDVTIGLAALGLGLIPLLERFSPGPRARARSELIAPRSRRETAAFTVVSVGAGVAEEVAYRGVLFVLLANLMGGVGGWAAWWLPAIVSAVAFGLAHLFQGWRGAGFAAVIAIAAQVVVGVTGTLLVAIAVHIVHDVIAGVVIGRRARRESSGGNPVAV